MQKAEHQLSTYRPPRASINPMLRFSTKTMLRSSTHNSHKPGLFSAEHQNSLFLSAPSPPGVPQSVAVSGPARCWVQGRCWDAAGPGPSTGFGRSPPLNPHPHQHPHPHSYPDARPHPHPGPVARRRSLCVSEEAEDEWCPPQSPRDRLLGGAGPRQWRASGAGGGTGAQLGGGGLPGGAVGAGWPDPRTPFDMPYFEYERPGTGMAGFYVPGSLPNDESADEAPKKPRN